jgi:DNA recombination protein Rad52
MAFDDKQNRALKAKLSYRKVKTRSQNGTQLPYIEGWQAIAEANRIFGYESWDRQTMTPKCLWSERQRGQLACLYSTKVRITVRAGGVVIAREGIGTGVGRADKPEAAHEIALKSAETDATKRALATFGNPFGLALYDKDKAQVTKPPKTASPPRKRTTKTNAASGDLVLTYDEDGRSERFATPEAFLVAILAAIPKFKTTSAVYTFWERNLATLTALRAQATGPEHDPVPMILTALKSRISVISKAAAAKRKGTVTAKTQAERPSQLAIPKERRLRDPAHLAFVARHPCLVCGRQPTQAHHIQFAQPRAMALKVSDEYTVPLCNGHHDSLHRTGDERAWWAARKLDPLAISLQLWIEKDKREEISLGSTPVAMPGSDKTKEGLEVQK